MDGLPIEVFGQQQDSHHNQYVGYRHYSPLIASIVETGNSTLKTLEKEGIEYKVASKAIPPIKRLAEPYLRRPISRPPPSPA